jgi:small-conductance mechanosensitive channel
MAYHLWVATKLVLDRWGPEVLFAAYNPQILDHKVREYISSELHGRRVRSDALDQFVWFIRELRPFCVD